MTRHDRLFSLLPAAVRLADARQGYPLRALLRVLAEQVNVVEDDIASLYDNWFVETCDGWVVPYIGSLVGYVPVRAAGGARSPVLVPRREVAGTIGYRRRKGTLALLEVLAGDVGGWPARAVEFYRLLAATQNVDARTPRRGRTVDVRDGDALELIDGPFDRTMHGAEVRRVSAPRDPGRYDIPSVGVFVWRLGSYPVTRSVAHAAEEIGLHAFTFSALSNDAPLFNRPRPEARRTDIAVERNLPTPMRRVALERLRLDGRLDQAYGEDGGFTIWVGTPPEPVPADAIVPADLQDWSYRPVRGQVAVDPERGRIAFPPTHPPENGVTVSYRYGFSADMGGGEYDRPLSEPQGAARYTVGEGGDVPTIERALDRWRDERPPDAVIEVQDSGVYAEQIQVDLAEGQTLQIRAANRTRPVFRLLDWRTDRSDALLVRGGPRSRFVLDGIVITGRGVQVQGEVERVTIRHATLVPGWGLTHDCQPRRPAEPSVVLLNTGAELRVEHAIVGSIRVVHDEVELDPECIRISDSILDATSVQRLALGGPESLLAHAVLTVARTTVIGEVRTHAVELGENSIFLGPVAVARRQIGCLRFCSVPHGSRTPRRFHCQPDLVEGAIAEEAAPGTPPADLEPALAAERLRVRPSFTSLRYGRPGYGQLATWCAPEIVRGADDESEMGAFHDLFQPQRLANLRARLDEHTPAAMEVGIVLAT
jgi:hypothetical protein